MEKEFRQKPYRLAPVESNFKPRSDTVVIALNSVNPKATSYEWARTFDSWTDLKFKRIFLFDPKASWWNGIGRWAKIVQKEVLKSGAKHVIVVGASMGAYGALIIGSLINADTVFAFAPQTIPTRHWPLVSIPCRAIMKKRQENKTIYHVYFSKFNAEDREHVNNISDLKNVILHPVESNKHKITKKLVRGGLVHKIVKKLLIRIEENG